MKRYQLYQGALREHDEGKWADYAEAADEIERLHRFLKERVIPRTNPREDGYHMQRVALEAAHLLREPNWFLGRKAAKAKGDES